MTNSPAYQDLCCRLVEDHYGDFYGTIFKCLVGSRFAAPQVAQKCHLPLRQAKAGLAGLVQLRLIRHHTPADAPTIYSANLTSAYNIIRAGKLIEAAHASFGETAGTILETLCDLGFASISELARRVLEDLSPDTQISSADVETLIDDLLDSHYLVHLRKAHLSESHDVRREVELKIRSPAEIAKLTGTKAKADHAHAVEIGFDGLMNTSSSEQGYVNNSWQVGAPQAPRNGTHPRARRAELVQPNFYKIVALAQSTVVADVARKLHGVTAATIMSCAIKQIADSDQWSRLPPRHVQDISVQELLDEYNREMERQYGSHKPHTNGINGKVNGLTSHDASDTLHIGDVNRELAYLNEGSFPFIQGSADRWTIDKGVFDVWLREAETLRVMDSRLEAPAPRILRILVDKGKLEERTLQEIGLLGAKELRQCLSLLKQMGYVDLQEVPRNPQRMPNQTVFLWSHETMRVQNLVLENLYAAIAKMVQLLMLEREKLSSTLTKIERADVKGREAEMLGEAELQVLVRFRRTEGWIWGEIHRLDATVAILRDT